MHPVLAIGMYPVMPSIVSSWQLCTSSLASCGSTTVQTHGWNPFFASCKCCLQLLDILFLCTGDYLISSIDCLLMQLITINICVVCSNCLCPHLLQLEPELILCQIVHKSAYLFKWRGILKANFIGGCWANVWIRSTTLVGMIQPPQIILSSMGGEIWILWMN